MESTTDVGSVVYTDEAAAYQGMKHRSHWTVKHSANEYVKGMAHTNGIESVWAVLKRGLHGTYHHVSVQQFGLRMEASMDDATTRHVFPIRSEVGVYRPSNLVLFHLTYKLSPDEPEEFQQHYALATEQAAAIARQLLDAVHDLTGDNLS